MTTKIQKLQRYISYSIIWVAIYSVLPYPKFGVKAIELINITFFWWVIQFIILYLFWLSRKYFSNKSQKQMMIWVQIYLLWNLFSILRGLFIAETYWDWKALVGNAMALTIPIVAYAATNTILLQALLKTYIKYALPLFAAFVFLIANGAYGVYLVPISFLALFFPIIKTPWRWIVLGVVVLVIFADFGARSNVIKFGVPFALSFLYYFRFFLSTKFFELVRKLLFVAPILFLALAVNGDFNIFKMNEYVKGDYVSETTNEKGQNVVNDLKSDTRTFLYIEVLKSAQFYNSWVFGRSPARGNISEYFGENDMNKRGERLGNEVAILNIFTWTGIIGVILYLLVFYRASYMAVNHSNNTFSKILGIFLAFRWFYSWIEDINNFSLTNFFLWVMIGMCFSKSFRAMSNKEVSSWVQGIFEKKKSMGRKIVYSPTINKTV